MADAGSLIENHEFVTDLARYAEGLYSEAAVKKKYHFDDATWASLGNDDALVEAIEAEKIRRIRSGAAKREKAQLHIVKAPDILEKIMSDEGANARHRIDSVKALDTLADNGPRATPAADRFIINIDLGEDYKLTIDKERTPLTPDEARKRLNDDKVIEGRPGSNDIKAITSVNTTQKVITPTNNAQKLLAAIAAKDDDDDEPV